MNTHQRGPIFYGLVLLTLAFAAVTAFLVYQYINQRQQLREAAFQSATRQAAQAASEIDAAFSEVVVIARQIADDLSSGDLAYSAIQTRLQAEVDQHPDIDGLAITFEPFVYDPELRLYQQYFYKTEDGTFDILDGASYDYSIPPNDEPDSPQTAWYHGPLANGPMWNEPFLATGAGKVLIEYGTPFYQTGPDNRHVPAGVVTIDYSLQDMRELMAAMDLGATGYSYVISASGTFLAHPVDNLVAQTTIFDWAAANEDPLMQQAAEQVLQGETVVLEREDPLTAAPSWLFFEPIGTTGWGLGIVLNQAEFIPQARQNLQEQSVIILAGAVALFGLCAVIFRADTGQNHPLWLTSFSFSLICTAAMILTWYLAVSIRENSGVQVTSQTDVERYLEGYQQRLNAHTSTAPIIIPTGIHIDALQFPDPTSVTVNGYIWQKYPANLPDDFVEGFSLPQLTGEEFTIEKVLTETQANFTVEVWYIGLTLRQSFDTLQFPFDQRAINIRILPADLTRSIILTPDFDGYNLINPRLLPGIDSGVDLYNWQLESSAFNYQNPSVNTNFGLQNRGAFGSVPELNFRIGTYRNFLGAFIAYLLPALVAAGMMFAYLISDRKPDDKDEVITGLNYAAALFFVIAVTHTALRESIAAVGLTYMEYFYILLYVSIIAVAVNTFLVVKRPHLTVIQYRGNFIPKLLYWPVMIGVLLIATLAIFVYNPV